MDLTEAQRLAHTLMARHGLGDWTFAFDRAKRRFGACRYTTRTISLSRTLTELNESAAVRETLLHEIAHALTPGAGHGPAWHAQCRELGIAAQRCYTAQEVVQPRSPYLLVCDTCGLEVPRHRKTPTPVACKNCCTVHNGGRYTSRYALRWVYRDA